MVKQKLTSRKFWMAVAGFVSSIMFALGATDADVVKVTAIIMAGASVIAYIIGEGLIDGSRAAEQQKLMDTAEKSLPDSVNEISDGVVLRDITATEDDAI